LAILLTGYNQTHRDNSNFSTLSAHITPTTFYSLLVATLIEKLITTCNASPLSQAQQVVKNNAMGKLLAAIILMTFY